MRKRIGPVVGICMAVIVIELISRLLIFNTWVLDSTPYLSETRWLLTWYRGHVAMKQPELLDFDQFDELLGWYPRPNAHNIRRGDSIVNFNTDSIRGTKEYSVIKPGGVTRIITFGDSFTFGAGVNDNDTYASQLESILPHTEVLNMAVHGYGIDQMLLRVKKDAGTFHPDIVIVAFIGDDITRATMKFRDYMKPVFMEKNGTLELSNVPVSRPETMDKYVRRTPATYFLFQLLTDRIRLRQPINSKTYESLAILIMERMIQTIQESSAIPVILFLPSVDELVNKNPAPVYHEELLTKICSKMKIVCFSARPYFIREKNLRIDVNVQSHYDAAMHRVIAQALAEDLIKSFPFWRINDIQR